MRSAHAVLGLVLLSIAPGCDSRTSCSPGLEGCACTDDGLCLMGLACAGGTCVRPGADGGVVPGRDAGAPPRACDACAPGQACSGGACFEPPSECPCPAETYCDLAMGRCVLGCTSDAECDPARPRLCDVAGRRCVDGCRSDAACGAGRICDAMVCRAGCRSTADCGAGQICDATTCRTGCEADTDCAGAGEVCDAGSRTCRAGCRSSADCPVGERCGTGEVCMAGCDATSRCPPGLECVSGACACTPGLTRCGDACVDTGTSREHCGGCSNACTGTLAACEGGVCNEMRPETGFWSACTVREDCPADQLCLTFGMPVISGYCTQQCGAGPTAATCPPPPSGTAVLACVPTPPRHWCGLDCSGGRRCPPTMTCQTLGDGSSFCR